MPMTIPNPATMISYQKSVDAGLVDKSYQKLMDQKIAVNADRVGWSPDLEWNQYARAEMIRGIGPKMQAALGMMTVGQFAKGMGFAALEPVIGKEGVTRLGNLQRALQACLPGAEEPVAHKQVSAERFAELFEADFNGHDLKEFNREAFRETVRLINSGESREAAIDLLGSAVAYQFLHGAMAAFEEGTDAMDIALQMQGPYHSILGQVPENVEALGQKIESVMAQYAGYVPEELQKALGIEPTEPVEAPMTADRFAEYAGNFNGRNLDDLDSVEDLMRDLGGARSAEGRQRILGDFISLNCFVALHGSIAASGEGMAAVEVAEHIGEMIGGMVALGKTPEEKQFIENELAKIGDNYLILLPEVVGSAVSEVWPA